ncbi:unnamed protein product [marine sediment metagenome]|uniref:Uncharacterized protein n=1 Tax=marine sediment metagenome TaxID=412755 RepID=X1EX45_9ZZZZ
MQNFDREDQENILRLLDGSVRSLHMKYRQITHNERAIPKLALIAKLTSKNTETTYWDFLKTMENHLVDDEVFNKFFYQKKKEDEEESI